MKFKTRITLIALGFTIAAPVPFAVRSVCRAASTPRATTILRGSRNPRIDKLSSDGPVEDTMRISGMTFRFRPTEAQSARTRTTARRSAESEFASVSRLVDAGRVRRTIRPQPATTSPRSPIGWSRRASRWTLPRRAAPTLRSAAQPRRCAQAFGTESASLPDQRQKALRQHSGDLDTRTTRTVGLLAGGPGRFPARE